MQRRSGAVTSHQPEWRLKETTLNTHIYIHMYITDKGYYVKCAARLYAEHKVGTPPDNYNNNKLTIADKYYELHQKFK